jgi:metal-responsive CopG/Arc/MetJ family transcriptional regulator
MSEQITIDTELLTTAAKLAGDADRSKVVEEALREFIKRRRKLQALVEIAGTIEFVDGYDHKLARKTRHDPS